MIRELAVALVKDLGHSSYVNSPIVSTCAWAEASRLKLEDMPVFTNATKVKLNVFLTGATGHCQRF